MIKEFKNLSDEERGLLLNAPVLVSVLASCSFNKINKIQKADAIKLSHLKTFTASHLLLPYYNEVEKIFNDEFEIALKKYFPYDKDRRNKLKEELDKVNVIIAKLDKEYGATLHKSLEGYEKHVKQSAHSFFQDFIFPLALPKFAN